MMHHINTLALAASLLVSTIQGLPHKPRAAGLTVSSLLTIAPKSGTCADAAYPTECRTAAQALKPIQDSFAKYDVTHPSVQAALISTIAYESGDFQFATKHFPAPEPGVGTRNMQMAKYNAPYAKALGLSIEQAMMQDEASFGSAAWYLATQCSPTTRPGMWGGSQAGFEAYVTQCVGATMDGLRLQYWERAVAALGTA